MAHAGLLSSVPFHRLMWRRHGPWWEKESSGLFSEPLSRIVWRTPWTRTCRSHITQTPSGPAGRGFRLPQQREFVFTVFYRPQDKRAP